MSSLPVDYEPSCISLNAEHPDVAVGGGMDNKVMIKIKQNILDQPTIFCFTLNNMPVVYDEISV